MSATVLDASAIEQLIPQIDVRAALEQMFFELGHGRAIQPAQSLTLLPGGSGDVICYQGVLQREGVFGIKMSPYIVTDDKPIITAWTSLMSLTTGEPLLLCDSGQLTTERTASTTALAIDLLSRSDSSSIAIIGSGPVAQAHWRYVADLRPWSAVRIWSPSLAQDPDKLSKWRSICPNATLATSAEAAAREADVVMLCTSSGVPVIDSSAIGPNALLTSISTNVAQAHEIDPEFLCDAQVYCDYRATTPQTAGEMVLASNNHGWQSDQICGDLAELVTQRCQQPQPGRPVFFRSIGLGLEDIAIANAIHKALSAKH